MAIAATNKTTGLDDTDQTTAYTTASVSFVATRLYLVSFVTHSSAAGAPTAQTATGGTLTFTEVTNITFATIATPVKRLTVFRCMPSADETTAVSLNQGAVNKGHGRWVIDEFTGIDTSGVNGAGAIVQSVTNRADTGTGLTVTLAAFGSTDNVGFGSFAHAANEVTTPGVGFTELGDVVGTETPTTSLETEWKLNDNTVDATWSTTTASGGIGIEIKAATGGAPVVARRLLLGVGV